MLNVKIVMLLCTIFKTKIQFFALKHIEVEMNKQVNNPKCKVETTTNIT